MTNDDNDIDWEFSCCNCSKPLTNLLSHVCDECRQQMMLIKITNYHRLLKRIVKLRWALGVSANQVQTLKKEVNGVQDSEYSDTVSIGCDVGERVARAPEVVDGSLQLWLDSEEETDE